MERIKFSNRERKILVLIGVFCNAPLLLSLFLYSGCSTEFPNSCILGGYFLVLATVLFVRNMIIMSRHDWYRTTYDITEDELKTTTSFGRIRSGKWKELTSIDGRTRPKQSYGQLFFWFTRDVLLLGRDVVLRFSDGTRIRIPRVGMSHSNHPILNQLAISKENGNQIEKLLYIWETWNKWLQNDRRDQKFGNYPSRSMWKWYIILQIPWGLVGMFYLGLNLAGISPTDILGERWDIVAYVISPLTFFGTVLIHLLLWLKQH